MKTNINVLPLPIGIPIALQFLQREIQALRQKKLVITLDGFSSSGKSTISKHLAEILEYVHVDSGAMYRAVTLQFLRANVSLYDDAQIQEILAKTHITFDRSGNKTITLLNGENVEKEIRSMSVSNLVSPVAAISEVRTFLVHQQRAMAGDIGIIMDGRDIGTVVFPNADIKFFINADVKLRAERRHKELESKGVITSYDEVFENLSNRDHIDSTRSDSPLVKAEDAIVLDTSHLSESEQIQEALSIIIKQAAALA